MSIYSVNEGILISTKRGISKVKENNKLVDKCISTNIKMVEDGINLVEELINLCGKKATKAMVKKAYELRDKLMALDYNRGQDDELYKMGLSFLKLRMQNFFNKADLKDESISAERLELEKKCSKNGEYTKRLINCKNKYKSLYDKLEKIAVEMQNNTMENENYYNEDSVIILRIAYDEMSWFNNQTFLTLSDVKTTKKYLKSVSENTNLFENVVFLNEKSF